MKQFNFLKHTADLKFEAFGKDVSEVFENSAKAMFSSLVKGNVKGDEKKSIELQSDDLAELLHDWLDELLFSFTVDGEVYKEFQVKVKEGMDGYELTAELDFDNFDSKKHEVLTEIKAVTYHDIKVEKKGKLWRSEVLCDI